MYLIDFYAPIMSGITVLSVKTIRQQNMESTMVKITMKVALSSKIILGQSRILILIVLRRKRVMRYLAVTTVVLLQRSPLKKMGKTMEMR